MTAISANRVESKLILFLLIHSFHESRRGCENRPLNPRLEQQDDMIQEETRKRLTNGQTSARLPGHARARYEARMNAKTSDPWPTAWPHAELGLDSVGLGPVPVEVAERVAVLVTGAGVLI